MTDKELRKLRRDDLLQILINQQKQIDTLTEELRAAKEALSNREIALSEVGSLAEATVRLNGVFEAAQSAADEYMAQVKKRADALAAEAEAHSAKSKELADFLVRDARSDAEKIREKARAEADQLLRSAQGSPAPSTDASAPEGEDKRRRRRLWGNRNS